jgi:hypothetical protein
VADGADPEEQRLILETWTRWYVDAVEALRDAEVGGSSPSTLRRIEETKQAIVQTGSEAGRAIR